MTTALKVLKFEVFWYFWKSSLLPDGVTLHPCFVELEVEGSLDAWSWFSMWVQSIGGRGHGKCRVQENARSTLICPCPTGTEVLGDSICMPLCLQQVLNSIVIKPVGDCLTVRASNSGCQTLFIKVQMASILVLRARRQVIEVASEQCGEI